MSNAISQKSCSARVGDDDTVDGLREAFREAVEDYLETCTKIGRDPQRVSSGQMMFRVNPEVHRKPALAADAGEEEPEPMGARGFGEGGGVMRINKLVWTVVASLMLSACCAPERCHTARS